MLTPGPGSRCQAGTTLLAKHCQVFSHARCPVSKSGYHIDADVAAYGAQRVLPYAVPDSAHLLADSALPAADSAQSAHAGPSVVLLSIS